jgi:hypothetical protein
VRDRADHSAVTPTATRFAKETFTANYYNTRRPDKTDSGARDFRAAALVDKLPPPSDFKIVNFAPAW